MISEKEAWLLFCDADVKYFLEMEILITQARRNIF